MEFDELILKRRSVRSYKEGQISEETICELLRAAVLAPSWKNSETGRYYVVTDPQKVEWFRTYLLPDFNQNNTRKASAYVVATFVKGLSGYRQENVPAGHQENEWGAYDLGLQNAYLLLKASELGLDSLIMGLYDEAGVREYFAIPENEEIMPVIALGYRDGEPRITTRKKPEDIVHFTTSCMS